MSANKEGGDGENHATIIAKVDGHCHHVSNLAHGINRIAVKHDNNEDISTANNNTLRRESACSLETGSASASASVGLGGLSMYGGSPPASLYSSAALFKPAHPPSPHQSSSSWDVKGHTRRLSTRWMDQKMGHNKRIATSSSDGGGSLTDDNAVVSFSMMNQQQQHKLAAANSSSPEHHSYPYHHSHHHHDSASQGDSHDESGYLSHSSGGYNKSYAASVTSLCATVCSGSVVEDIDMASIASDGRKSAHPAQHHPKDEDAKCNALGVEFASNILNDMGPPQALCSALLLAANAACKPSSGSLSFNKNKIGDGESSLCGDSVNAAVDTDDCCDRSVDLQSEVSTLHSQDGNMEEKMNSSTNHSINLPLQRFQEGPVDVSQLQRGEDDWSSQLQRGEDDWSRSHSRSHSRGSLSSASSRSRSRSRSRSPSDGGYHRQNNIPSWYRGREPVSRQKDKVSEDMEDTGNEYRVEFKSDKS